MLLQNKSTSVLDTETSEILFPHVSEAIELLLLTVNDILDSKQYWSGLF